MNVPLSQGRHSVSDHGKQSVHIGNVDGSSIGPDSVHDPGTSAAHNEHLQMAAALFS